MRLDEVSERRHEKEPQDARGRGRWGAHRESGTWGAHGHSESRPEDAKVEEQNDPWQAWKPQHVESGEETTTRCDDSWRDWDDCWHREEVARHDLDQSFNSSDLFDGPADEADMEQLAFFVGLWGLRLEETQEILRGLTTEEIGMVLRRFSVEKYAKVPPEVLLRCYVNSCRRNGFKPYHPSDKLAEFAATWNMTFQQVQEIMAFLSLEKQREVTKEYYCEEASIAERLEALRRFVRWQDFAHSWDISLKEVVERFRLLREEDAEVVMKRFRFNNQSAQMTACEQFKRYVSSCQTKGFWVSSG